VVGGAWRTDLRWQTLGEHLPATIEGSSVLDVGSNAGYDPFMFRHRGAGRVVACEPFEFIRQAQFLESIYRSGIEILPLGWQQLDPADLGTFDIVHCHGVLYHDLNPVALLQRLRAMVSPGGTLLFGSMMLDDPELSEYARFVPGEYYGDPTWWWVPGRLAMRWMLEAAGFAVDEEFGVSEGPRGEFPVVNGYFRAGLGTVPEHAPTAW
jgi:tRNA (mo5U34)-methyltransferase